MEVLLDTNFIISCVKKGIPFLDQLQEQGFNVRLPRSVYQELKDIRLKSSPANRDAVEIALKIVDNKGIKKISLGQGSVDKELIKKGQSGMYIASLDAAIKHAVPNRVVIEDSKKAIKVERD